MNADASKNFPVVNVSVSKIDPDVYYRETETEAHKYMGENTLGIVENSVEIGEIQTNDLLKLDGLLCHPGIRGCWEEYHHQ